jgi:hypothetical protein
VALNKLRQFAAQQNLLVHTLQTDVEKQPPPPNSFDVIVVSQFLYRPICTALIAALKPAGLLYYQTFNNKRVTGGGPSNANYLLGCNELLSLFTPLTIRAYREEGRSGDCQQGLRDMSYLVAQKPPC